MKRISRGLAVASPLLLALLLGQRASAQKSGGILKISFFDSPASMSMHEEATGSALRPMMGVFNNLVMYRPARGAEPARHDRPGPRHRLGVERRRHGADFQAAPGRQMA